MGMGDKQEGKWRQMMLQERDETQRTKEQQAEPTTHRKAWKAPKLNRLETTETLGGPNPSDHEDAIYS